MAKSTAKQAAGQKGALQKTEKQKQQPIKKQGSKKWRFNYPRAGKGAIRRWLPSWRFLLGTLLSGFALGIGLFLGLYVSTTVPEPADFALAQSTKVYYDDGKTEIGSLSEVNRSVIAKAEIPAVMKNAVVASEDRTFYENNGISLKGIARALWNNLRGGATQGGSTLTQQYAERYYLGSTTSLLGKAKEAVLALKIDRSQSKDDILANYLNTIYFGRGAYGVEAAAQAYFGVPAKELTLEQAALLTALIPAPSAWDPAVNLAKAQQRYTRVLNLMAEDEWISAAERDAALAAFPQTLEKRKDNAFAGANGYLLTTVKDELVQQAGFSEEQVANGGYKIVSTFNQEKQQLLIDAVNQLPQDRPAGNRVGGYSMNPQNGEVYALYGGSDYLKQQQNDATQSHAQAGSTFKIFTLVAAIEKGIPLHQKYSAPAKMKVPGTDHEISNNANIGYGALDLVGMTKTSANTPFVNLNLEIGPQSTVDMAVKLGLPEKTPGLDANVGNSLGSASVTAKQMATAYSVVANEGKLQQAHTVRLVKNPAGATVYAGETKAKQVISKESAALASHAFQAVFDPGTFYAKRIGAARDRHYAGKSGTSSGPVSAWFIGYTPQMVTAVNMFQSGANGEQQTLTPFGGVRTIYGENFPFQIWWNYTKAALAGTPALDFPEVDSLLAKQRPAQVTPAPQEPTPAENEAEQNEDEAETLPAAPAPQTPAPATPPVPPGRTDSPGAPPATEQPAVPDNPSENAPRE